MLLQTGIPDFIYGSWSLIFYFVEWFMGTINPKTAFEIIPPK
jgi:hypothetical protein